MHRTSKMAAWLSLAMTLPAFPAIPSRAHGRQGGGETAVHIIKTVIFRYCADIDGGVVDEETFRKLVSEERCAALKELDVDFNAHTLIAVVVRGDCHVRATLELTRDDDAGKYTAKIKKVYGGCRAAGRFERWVMVEKLRPDYRLEFTTVTSDRDEETTER